MVLYILYSIWIVDFFVALCIIFDATRIDARSNSFMVALLEALYGTKITFGDHSRKRIWNMFVDKHFRVTDYWLYKNFVDGKELFLFQRLEVKNMVCEYLLPLCISLVTCYLPARCKINLHWIDFINLEYYIKYLQKFSNTTFEDSFVTCVSVFKRTKAFLGKSQSQITWCKLTR